MKEYISGFLHKYIKNNEIFDRFIKVFSVDVLVRGANFLLIPVFLYLMTKEEFGIYGYLYSFAMTVSGILNFGFYASISKLYADSNGNKHTQGSMLFSVTITLLVLVAISLIIMFFTKLDVDIFTLFNKDNDINASVYINYRVYVFITILSMIFTNFITFYFVASEQISKVQMFNLFRFLLSNGIAILILYTSKEIDTAMVRLAITYSMELLLTIIFGFFLFKEFIMKYEFFFVKKAFKIGTPMMLSAIVYAMMNFGDKFFVVKYAGIENFAVYNLGILLSTIILIVFNSFNVIWLPLFFKEKNLLTLRRKTRRYTLFMFLGFFLFGVFIWIGTYIALQLNIMPKNYSSILPILPILIISQIFAAQVGLLFNYMTYFEKTYIHFFLGIVLSIIGYFLFDYFVKEFYGLGAAIVLLILNILSFVFYFIRTEYYINNRLINNENNK